MANRCDLKPVSAIDHDARHQRVDAHGNNAGALFDRPPQCGEIVVLPLPVRNFDANTVRRQMDHEGPAPCIHACSSEVADQLRVSLGRDLDAVEEIMMTIPLAASLMCEFHPPYGR
jgi:hypothetical protein